MTFLTSKKLDLFDRVSGAREVLNYICPKDFRNISFQNQIFENPKMAIFHFGDSEHLLFNN